MKNENDQPNREGKRPDGKSDKHQPAQDAESIKQMPVVFPVDHAGMDRALIHFATVRVRDPAARYHRPDRRERDKSDKRQNDPIRDPRKALSNRQRRRIHDAGYVFLNPSA